MRYMDIQLSDESLRQQFIDLMEQGAYEQALPLLANTTLAKKLLNAQALNSLTDSVVTVENLDDPTFKANKIQVSNTAPAGLTAGQVYFQLI